MRSKFSVDISTSTTQRRLREAGLHGCKARKKPHLTVAHRRARLCFARDHKDWTAEQWSKVIFSDESRFLLFRSDGRAYVQRAPGEEFHECLQATVKHGGGGIMVWGCINSRGVGHLKKVEGRLNASAYIDLLENCLIPSVHFLSMPRGWIFQQDNATCHMARTSMAWLTTMT